MHMPTFDTPPPGPTGAPGIVGDNTAATLGVAALYAAEWHASNAEMTDANLKALLQAMGFVIAWS